MSQPRQSGDAGSATRPQDDLTDIWDALDTLPRPSSPIDMAATTIEMVAASMQAAAKPAPPSGMRRWVVSVAVVATSLLAGVVAGRMIAFDPDARILEQLPLVRHVDLLREAGSVDFLQKLAARTNQLPVRVPPEFVRREGQEFDAALRDLEADHRVAGVPANVIASRRAYLESMSAADRDALKRSLATFQELTTTQRRDLAAVGKTLADPRREELRTAARLWHRIIAASDPADRRNIVELDADGRIEWLERRWRQREWNGERRGPPPGFEGGPPPRGPGGRGRGELGPRDGGGPRSPPRPRGPEPPRTGGPSTPAPPRPETPPRPD
jgi:hypothetical protein